MAETSSSSLLNPKFILWLVILSLALFFAPLYLLSTTLQADNDSLQTEYDQLQLTLAITPAGNPTDEALTAQLLTLQGHVVAIEAFQPTLAAEHINWAEVMFMLGGFDPSQISILAMSQSGRQLTLQGQAVDEAQAIAYAQMLKSSDLFNDVTVQSIVANVATPQAGATTSTLVEFIILVDIAV